MTEERPIYKNLEELKLYDVQKKLNLARHIITACMDNTIERDDIRKNSFYLEAEDYISSPNLLTKTISEKIEKLEKPRTFSDWFQEISNEYNDSINDTSEDIDMLLRNAIVDHYIHMQILPNLNSIRDHLNDHISITVEELKKILRTKGYKTQCLPRHNSTIIVEDPKQRYQRMKYLQSMINYRELDYHIVYVDEKIMDNFMGNGESIQILAAALSTAGIICETVNKTIFRPRSNNNDHIILVDDWIINNVLPQLTKSSVIVFGNLKNSIKESFSDTPTIYSRKTDMIKWLNQNDIPHSPKMHTAELFELIKRSKSKFSTKKYKLDEILLGHGHKVLRRPKRTQYLNIFEPIWRQIQAVYTKKGEEDSSDFIKRSLLTISSDTWKTLDISVINMETNIYNDDNAIDEAIDKLFTFAKYETIPRAYINQCDEEIDEVKISEIVII